MKTGFQYIVFLWILSSCTRRAEPEIHLLQEGFRGRVDIVFERSDGKPPKYEGKYRVYEIPPKGFLKTQFSFPRGVFQEDDVLIYYVNSHGKRTRIYERDPLKKGDTTKVYGFVSGEKYLEECDLTFKHILEYVVDSPQTKTPYYPLDFDCEDVK